LFLSYKHMVEEFFFSFALFFQLWFLPCAFLFTFFQNIAYLLKFLFGEMLQYSQSLLSPVCEPYLILQ